MNPDSIAAALRPLGTPECLRLIADAEGRFSMHDEVRALLAVAAERLAVLDHGRDQAERTTPAATTTVEHARIYVHANRSEGVTCPVCDRLAKVYSRKIDRQMARGLLAQYRAVGQAMTDTRDIWPKSGSGGPTTPLLRHWGILEEGDEDRHWRVTDLGVQWIHGYALVPSHALLYNNGCLGLDGDPFTFRQALREPFDLDELMAERPYPLPTDPAPRLF